MIVVRVHTYQRRAFRFVFCAAVFTLNIEQVGRNLSYIGQERSARIYLSWGKSYEAGAWGQEMIKRDVLEWSCYVGVLSGAGEREDLVEALW